MAAQRKYPEELRERTVKMVSESRERDRKGHGELAGVGRQLGRRTPVRANTSAPRIHAVPQHLPPRTARRSPAPNTLKQPTAARARSCANAPSMAGTGTPMAPSSPGACQRRGTLEVPRPVCARDKRPA